MYKNFSETLLRLIEGEKKQTVTIGKGDFSIRKAGLILLAGEDKRTQEKTFIIYLPGINLAQRVKLDEATGNCLPVGGLLSFEHGSQGVEMLRLFDKLVKLPQWSPWDERPRVLEMFSPAQLLRLTQIGFNVIDINYLASRKIDCKSVIEKLDKIGAISEYGYLKLYVLSGREKDFFERIEGIEKVCGENQGFNYYSVNYVLGLFYQWSDWVKKTSEKEGTKFFVRIPDIVDFELWIDRLNKRPIEIEYWNKHELENNFRGSERRKWIERCNINSKQKYEDLAKAIIKVILRDKISITLGDIEVKREDIMVFTYQTSKSGRWSYCFYDKKNRLSVVVGDNDKLLLLSDMMPIGFKNGKIMNVMPIFDGSNPGVWKDDLIRKYLASDLKDGGNITVYMNIGDLFVKAGFSINMFNLFVIRKRINRIAKFVFDTEIFLNKNEGKIKYDNRNLFDGGKDRNDFLKVYQEEYSKGVDTVEALINLTRNDIIVVVGYFLSMTRKQILELLGVSKTSQGNSLKKLKDLKFFNREEGFYVLGIKGKKLANIIKNGGEINNNQIINLGLRKWNSKISKHGRECTYVTIKDVEEELNRRETSGVSNNAQSLLKGEHADYKLYVAVKRLGKNIPKIERNPELTEEKIVTALREGNGTIKKASEILSKDWNIKITPQGLSPKIKEIYNKYPELRNEFVKLRKRKKTNYKKDSSMIKRHKKLKIIASKEPVEIAKELDFNQWKVL
ncbi:MAG: hypothetical protein KAI91_03680, partial [Candidatus Omnitrophica bacterium]|nr:hypothetical protein [Candidatus Omnitrophota bacterium]